MIQGYGWLNAYPEIAGLEIQRMPHPHSMTMGLEEIGQDQPTTFENAEAAMGVGAEFPLPNTVELVLYN